MGKSPTGDMSDQEFFFGYVAQFLDAELTPDLRSRFEKLLQDQNYDNALRKFQEQKGKLQLAMQAYSLNENQIVALHNYVQDPVDRETVEAAKIEQVGRRELASTILRYSIFLVIIGALVFGAVYLFTPKGKGKFNSLEYLYWEALAMEEDPAGRLDLPTNDLQEIEVYLRSYPSLGFKAPTLRSFSKNWRPDGATVLDYETAKVAVVQYSNVQNENQKLFHFSYPATLGQLPKAEAGNYRGLIYQTYSSDELNAIAWQQGEDTVSFLVGRLSAAELANLARVGVGN